MDSVFNDFNHASSVISFIFVVLLLIGSYICLFFLLKRKFVRITSGFFSLAAYFLYIFELDSAFYLCLGIYFLFILTAIIVNLSEFRFLFGNKFNENKAKSSFLTLFKKKNNGVEKIINREELDKIIYNTVVYLSNHKTGAIITFEKNDNLEDAIKNGTIVNAPVSAELLETIFYTGTRLHDGAVIIKGATIVAASVYYAPTTKPLLGKFGSRHRAAIGISETCDAVTVVVSEETGRISIAYNGELETVTQDNFINTFENYMNITSSDKEGK